MNNNEKYYTDQQFEQMNICYMFCVYCNKRNADLRINCTNLMPWNNNNLTRETAQNILMGIAAAATIKYKYPVAVLYADTPDGNRIILSSCRA
jgi:hypothetical protein